MNKIASLIGALSLIVSGSSYASFDINEEKPNVFGYNYVEGGYMSLDGDFTGFGLAGSFDLKPNLSLIGSYYTTSNSDFSTDVDFNSFSIGAAYHFQFDNTAIANTDLSLHAEYVNYEIGFSYLGTTYSDDTNGLRFGAKARHQLNTQIELFVDVYMETSDANDLVINPGIVFSINEQLSVVGSYQIISDIDALFIGARMNF